MIPFLTDSIPVVGMGMSLLRVQVGLSCADPERIVCQRLRMPEIVLYSVIV